MKSSTVCKLPIAKNALGKVCRICIRKAMPPSLLFSIEENLESLADLIWKCTGIRFNKGDGLPEVLCPKCCSDLYTANEFRNSVYESDQMLQKYISPKSNIQINDDTKIEEILITPARSDYKKCNIKTKPTADDDTSNPEIKMELEETDHYNDINPIDSEDDFDPIYCEDNKDPIESEDDNDEKVKKITKKYTCDICKRPLISEDSLKNHVKRMHSGKKKMRNPNLSGWGSDRHYHCPECSYKTPRSQTFVYHMRTHTGEKPYKCDECDVSFAQPGALSGHKKTHSNKMNFTCTECGRQFKVKSRYELHRKIVHVAERNFPCTKCDKKFKSKPALTTHLNRHNNIRNYNCETCGATFVSFVDLFTHKKRHIKEKKHKCHLCEYGTNIKKALDNHLRRHSGERPFKCSTCEWSCFTRGDLKCHMRKHTKEKNYPCRVCKKKFRYSRCVNRHMLKDHGIKFKWADEIDRRVLK